MTYEERNALLGLILMPFVVGVYVWLMIGLGREEALAGPDALKIWARLVLGTMAGSIVVTIIAAILFNILWAIATRDPKPSFVVDERDRMIGIFGLRVLIVVVSVGFIAALVALALGYSALLALNLTLAGFAAGNFADCAVRMYLYRQAG